MNDENLDNLYWWKYDNKKYKNRITNKITFLLNQYFSKYKLIENNTKDIIKNCINDALIVQKLLEEQNKQQLNLIDEAEKISEALDVLLKAQIFRNDEPEPSNCDYYTYTKKYNDLISDLTALKNEKISVHNIYKIMQKYPNLNKIVILSAFKQSKKVIPTELVILIKSIISKYIKNKNDTKVTENTKILVENIFDVNISDRDLTMYKDTYTTYQLLSSL